MNLINNKELLILGALWLSMIQMRKRIGQKLKMLKKLFGDSSSTVGSIKNCC